MKNNIKRLQRWLDRLAAACESGKWESAISEADCLSAEVHDTREKLLMAAEAELTGSRGRARMSSGKFSLTLKSSLIALLIVFGTTVPLAVEPQQISASLPVAAVEEKPSETVEPANTDSFANTLRKKIEDSSYAAVIPTESVKAAAAQDTPRPTPPAKRSVAPARTAPKPAAAVQAPRAKHTEEAASFRAEDLLSLIQAGERALKNERPAIKVEY